MTTATLPMQPSFLKKNLFLGVTISTVFIIFIMALSFGLHMYNIESIGDANAYYTAAVKSMLQSWSNFFFIAAEPGGSVTVDKPPLGLWIEAIFAYFLGVSGFSVSLPNILAGVFGIPLLYIMVKKYMGELAGLTAALVMALTPVFVATNRNNTMDGMLVFFLLVAAWAFIQATESGKLRWVLLGAFIVGLGFNIKMMQAFLPLPAFYALYFLGSKEGWLRKIINLSLATVLLLVVSLSWAVVVDLVPADSRPYIGSSENNTVMGLIFGHNGISRLEGGGGPGGSVPQNGTPPSAPVVGSPTGQETQPQPINQTQGGQATGQTPPQEMLDACASSTESATCSFTGKNGNTVDGSCTTFPNSDALACAPQGVNQQNGQQAPTGQTQANDQATQPQSPDGQNTRQGPPQEALDACATSSQDESCSFTTPNGNSINGTCIIPRDSTELACAPQGGHGGQNAGGPAGNGGPGGGGPGSQETGEAGVLRFFTTPLSKQMSWLLPFAIIAGLLALFGARLILPLEAGVHKALIIWGGWLLTCVVFFSAVSGIFHSYYAIMLAPALGAVVGIGFAQLWQWGSTKKWAGITLIVAAVVTIAFQLFATYQYGEQSVWMILAGVLLIAGSVMMFVTRRAAYITILSAMLIVPAYWTVMTVSSGENSNLPTAYSGNGTNGADRARQQDGAASGTNVNTELVDYLQTNTQDIEYLVAVPSSMQGSNIVIATGRPVLLMGGFGGQDDVVSAEDLSSMVANNELRYVLYGGERGNKEEIASWLKTSCSVVPEFSNVSTGNQPAQGQSQQDGQNQADGQGGGGPRDQSTTLYVCK